MTTVFNFADTTTMLTKYKTGINAKINILDIVSMLQPYLRYADTTSMLFPYFRDAYSTSFNLENRLSAKINIVNTANMLLP
jgi:ribosomal protein L21E